MIPLIKNTFLNEEVTKSALARFVESTPRLSMGEHCAYFERQFSKEQDCKHSILFNSGGSANLALLQAMKNLGMIKRGDKVGFSAITWATNVMPIIQMSLIPVAIDVEINNLNVSSLQLIETLETTNLKVLFLTNALGFCADIENIKMICNNKNIILIEDNCESLGTETMMWGKTGNFGIASTFSFFVAHHLSTIEGGMVCTDNEEISNMLKIVRANGWDRNLTPTQQLEFRKKYKIESEFASKYTFYDLGFNLRPTEITGFLGAFQLPYLQKAIQTRARNYLEIESVMEENNDLILIDHKHIKTLSPFAIPVVCKSAKLRDYYLLRFFEAGIEVRPMIAGNIQTQPFYKKYVKTQRSLPNATFLHECSFYCGNYPEMESNDLDIIKSALK